MPNTWHKNPCEFLQNNILRKNFMPSSIMTRGCPYCLNDRVIPSATSTESLWHKNLPIKSFTEANFYAETRAKSKIAQVFNTHP